MKRYTIYMAMLFAFTLFSCSDEMKEGVENDGNVPVATFNVTTRASDNSADNEISDKQFTRLFLAERLSEHTESDGSETLHCDVSNRFDLDGSTYQLEGLKGQWYKFAFVCVPALNDMGSAMFVGETKEYSKEHDFNKLMVDYQPVLDYQALDPTAANNDDLSVYRKIIDRWVDATNPTSEDVALTRVTGQLILDMGKPADQFENPVSSITLTVATPSRFYIRDEAEDQVIVDDNTSEKNFTINTSEKNFTINVSDPKARQILRVSLLPGELTDAKVTVNYGETSEEFVLQNENKEPIQIKKNTRTTVLFNGMHPDEFEVRYAGFDDGNDAVIDVSGGDKDEWNGVN